MEDIGFLFLLGKLPVLSFEWEVVGEAEQGGFWERHSLHVVI